jgi:hypothetical protein
MRMIFNIKINSLHCFFEKKLVYHILFCDTIISILAIVLGGV